MSGWNDNGFKGLAKDERRLFRTDYFPGLGWMIRNDTWALLRGIWPRFPSTGWDHWLRHGSGLRTKKRDCILPEVPRTHHFDLKGTNVKKGTELAKNLARMAESRLQSNELGDLSYLLQGEYDTQLLELTRDAPVVSPMQIGQLTSGLVYRVPYVRENYKELAKRLQIYPVQPRTAHRGVVITRTGSQGNSGSAVVVLVDRRKGQDLLPEQEQWHPHEARKVAKAEPGESCAGYCQRVGMSCSARELEFINHCEALREVFPCEDGCGHQVGQEIPCYVHDGSRDTARQCLVTDDAVPTCAAKNPSTTRLCTCVPIGEA